MCVVFVHCDSLPCLFVATVNANGAAVAAAAKAIACCVFRMPCVPCVRFETCNSEIRVG